MNIDNLLKRYWELYDIAFKDDKFAMNMKSTMVWVSELMLIEAIKQEKELLALWFEVVWEPKGGDKLSPPLEQEKEKPEALPDASVINDWSMRAWIFKQWSTQFPFDEYKKKVEEFIDKHLPQTTPSSLVWDNTEIESILNIVMPIIRQVTPKSLDENDMLAIRDKVELDLNDGLPQNTKGNTLKPIDVDEIIKEYDKILPYWYRLNEKQEMMLKSILSEYGTTGDRDETKIEDIDKSEVEKYCKVRCKHYKSLWRKVPYVTPYIIKDFVIDHWIVLEQLKKPLSNQDNK
jgi:hypothetical protein